MVNTLIAFHVSETKIDREKRESDRGGTSSSAHVVAAARFVWHPQIFMTMFGLGSSKGEGKQRGRARGRVETWVHSS